MSGVSHVRRALRNGALLALLAPLLAFAAVPGLSGGANPAASVAAAPAQEMVTRLIVKPHPVAGAALHRSLQARDASALAQLGQVPMRVLRPMSGGAHVIELDHPVSLSEARAIAARLSAHGGVEVAEPDQRRHHLAITPTDPSYAGLQWNLFAPTSGHVGSANLPDAWGVSEGSNAVTVAVIDTGYRPHQDLGFADNGSGLQSATVLAPGYNFISDAITANNGTGRGPDALDTGDWVSSAESSGTSILRGCTVENSTWHGTHVAGIIAAQMNNIGIAGVAPNVRILPVRVLGKCGGTDSDIADGMRWAAGLPVTGVPLNTHPAQVLNMSLGGSNGSACPATYQSAINEIIAAGKVVVVAAGNDGSSVPSAPANCVGVITVTGNAIDGDNAWYATVGPEVAISAPGGGCGGMNQYCGNGPNVHSLVNSGTTTPAASPGGDSYVAYAGTSMATPHVAAVAALMFSVNPALTPAQVKSLLQATARPFPLGTICTQVANPGECGAGLVDAYQAVAAALSAPPAVTLDPAMPGIVAPATTVLLSGSALAASGKSIVSYAWTQVYGETAVPIANANQANASFVAPATGTYAFGLTATDSAGQTASAAQVILVNSPPVLDAIAAKSVLLNSPLSFTVTATDADGNTPVFHSVSVPAGATLSSTGQFSWRKPSPVGSYTLTYYASDSHANSANGSVSISVLSSQKVTFGTAPTVVAGGTGTVSATGGASGNPVTFSSLTASYCSVSDAVVTGIAVGTCTIAANQAGNASYAAAPQVTQSMAIGKGNQTIVFGAAPSLSVAASAGLSATGGASGNAVTFSSTTPTVCSVSGASVTGLTVGSCTVAANQAGTGSYAAAAQVTQTLAVTQGSQTIGFIWAPSLFYHGTVAAGASATSGLSVTLTSSTPDVCSTNGSSVSALTMGTCTITATQAGDTNYLAAQPVSQSVSVARASQTIVFSWSPSLRFGGSPVPVSASLATGLPVTLSSSTPAVCATDGTTVSPLAAGTCTITATQAGDTNYLPATPVSQSVVVSASAQSIAFAAPSTAGYGDAPIALSASASSNLPVGVTLVSGPATLNGSTLTLTGAGSVVLRASQSGNGNYLAAADVTQTIAVAPRAMLITASNATRAYGAPNPASPGFSAPALVGGDSIASLSYAYAAGASATANVGTSWSITPSAAVFASGSAANYSIAYAAGTLTIAGQAAQSIAFTPTSTASYGDAPIALSASASSNLPVGLALVSGPATLNGTTLSFTGAGSVVLRANQGGDGNYLAAADVTQTITVAPRPLVITASNASRAYGAANPAAPGFSAPALVGGDSIASVSYAYAAGASATANVGTSWSITPSAAVFASGSAANYSIAYASGTLSIAGQAVQSITFTAPSTASYGDAPIALSASASSNLPVGFALVSGPATLNGATLTLTGAGSVVLRASQGGNGNYLAAADVTQTITVAPRPLVITASNASRAYGAANPAAPGFSAPALVGGDSITSVSYAYAAGASATANVGTSWSITPSAAVFASGSAANYSIAYAAGTLSIAGQAVQSIAFTPTSTSNYGDAPIALSASATSGLPVAITLVSGPATLNGSTLTLTGAGSVVLRASQGGNGNYLAAADVTQTITVAPRTLLITASNASRAYGAANPAAPGFSAPALMGSDSIASVSYAYAAGASATANVGTSWSITPSAAVFASGSSANYSIAYAPGTLSIAGQAAQSIAFTAPSTASYGDAVISLSASATSGLPVGLALVSGPATLNGATLTLTGAGSVVLRASQGGNGNYLAAADVTQTITVAPRPLVITASNVSRSYGAANPAAPGFSAPALVGSDSIASVSYAYAAGASATANVGTDWSITPSAAVFASGSAANYSITYAPGTLSIAGQAVQSIAFTAPSTASYGDAAISLSASATSGLPVGLTLVSGPATLSGATLTLTGAGSVVLRASQVGNGNYLSAADVTQTITVAPRPLVITANNANRAYGAANPTAPGFGAPALVGSDSIVGVSYAYAAGASATANVGTSWSITPSAAVFASGSSANYSIAYAPGTLSIAGQAAQSIAFTAPSTASYGDTPIALSASASSNLPVGLTLVSGPATLNGATLTLTGAGSVVLRASQVGNGNYLAATDVTQTITVAPRPLVITASNATRAYGAANPAAPGFSAPALVGSDSIASLSYAYAAGASATANVGTSWSITPSAAVFASGSAANYSIAYAAGTLTIAGQAAQGIVFTPPSTASYGDAPIALSASASSDLPVGLALVSGPATLNGSTLTLTGAGSVVLRASQVGNGNYLAATDVTQTITVAPRPLVITASNTSRAYGAANPAAPGFSAPALVGSDSIASVSYAYAAGASATANVGTTWSITPSAALFANGSAANYSIAYAAGTLSIAGQAAQSITFGNAPALVTRGTGILNATGGASGNAVVFASATSLVCSVSGSTVTGLAAGNCSVTANQAGNVNFSAAEPVTQTFAVEQGSYSLSLAPGWNLAGNAVDMPIDVTRSFADSSIFLTVWKWSAAQGSWSFYAPSLAAQGGTVLSDYAAAKGYQLLTRIAPGEGFWVKASQATSLTLDNGNPLGVEDLAPTLGKGWNLVCTGSDVTPSAFGLALAASQSIQGAAPVSLTTLWAWDTPLSQWYFYAPSLDASGGLADYIATRGYLDFSQRGRTLGLGIGFWLNLQ